MFLSEDFVELKTNNIAISDYAALDNIAIIAPVELVMVVVDLICGHVEDFYVLRDGVFMASKNDKAHVVYRGY